MSSLSSCVSVDRTNDFASIVHEKIKLRSGTIVSNAATTANIEPRKRTRRGNPNKHQALENFTSVISSANTTMHAVQDAYEVAYNVLKADLDNNQASEHSRLHTAETMRFVQSRLYERITCEREAKQRSHATLDTTSAAARTYELDRVRRIQDVTRQLNTLSDMFSNVNEILHRQMLSIESIEMHISAVTTRIDASTRELEDAAPRVYHKLRYNVWQALIPHTFGERLRLAFVLFFTIYTLLLVCEII